VTPNIDLLLLNAQVITMNPRLPRASSVAVGGGRIRAVGDSDEIAFLRGCDTRVVDCQGGALVPGFHDAHCHFLALASSVLALDCGSERALSIVDIKQLIRGEAAHRPRGRWIRARDYDDGLLAEGRHPTALDLDDVTPFHPVRLEHRSGHATVLNSQAMALLGVTRETPDLADGVIARGVDGRPTGLFLEMSSHIRGLMANHRREGELEEGVERANRLLLSRGITSLQDAGADNDLSKWKTFRRLKGEGLMTPRVTMMAGHRYVDDFLARGLGPGSGDEGLRLGAAKVMVTLTTGALYPGPEELRVIAHDVAGRGFQMALHAVEEESILAAAGAIVWVGGLGLREDRRHRIEHCSEGTPRALEAVAGSGAMVVTQPGFIYHNGDRYLDLVEEDLRPYLYPMGSLVERGIPWAAGSDAPVASVNPLLDLYAAATRRTAKGRVLGPGQTVDVGEALRAWTLGAAESCFREGEVGSVEQGKLADLVLLDGDPTRVPPEDINNLKVLMTVAGGEVVWEG
jgi:predicted amidohydrolase YtcJ